MVLKQESEMATSPSYAPVSPVRDFQHKRADFNLTNINERISNEGGIDSAFSRLSDRSIHDVSNHDSSNGSSSQLDGPSSSHSPLAGGSTTCRSRNKSQSESSRVCSPPHEPWKQHQSHFRPWLAPSKSNDEEPSSGDASSKRFKPYNNVSPKQLQQKNENDQ